VIVDGEVDIQSLGHRPVDGSQLPPAPDGTTSVGQLDGDLTGDRIGCGAGVDDPVALAVVGATSCIPMVESGSDRSAKVPTR
jgi:hypothetical protein